MARKFLFAIFLALATLAARATPQQHDANDLWIVPEESGWGLNLFHQGDTLFGSLFVYGPDGRARWYTASSLVGDDGGQFHDRPSMYNGALYESTGPAIGTAFDPSRVTRRQVGTMGIELGTDFVKGNYARVAYTIDGVQVSKTAYPFSFVRMGLSGTYTGVQILPGGAQDDVNYSVTLNDAQFMMTTTGTQSGSCMYSGTQTAHGSLFNIENGMYSCNDGRSGGFGLGDVDVTLHGFTAKGASGGIAAGRTSGAIRGDGYRTDLWWNAAESGWGLNIIEQGDALFGTLFVYDASGQPHWYSASDLAYEQCAPPDAASDCNGRYRGAVYESTGPYFGTSFNPAAVTRRQVGTMTFDTYGENTSNLDYTIDGVTVTHKPLTRATFRANSLAGTYAGYIVVLAGLSDRGVQNGPMTMGVSESGDTITVTMQGARGTCTMRGARSQHGRQGAASGAYDCGGATIGQLELSDVYVTWTGFTGAVGMDGHPIGRIEGLRTSAH